MRVATIEVGTLQSLLGIERQGPTFDFTIPSSTFTRETQGVTRDLGFDAVRLLHTHAYDDPILRTGFGRLCHVVFDFFGHV